jgi:hypothetical protein
MKQPTNNTNYTGSERFDSLSEVIQQTFKRDVNLFKEDLQGKGSYSHFVNKNSIQGLDWAYNRVVKTNRYEDTIDILVDNAICSLSDWIPCDKEYIEYVLECQRDDISEIIAELVLLATSLEEYHSSAEGWRSDTIVEGLTTRKIILPPVRTYSSEVPNKEQTLLTYVMKWNTYHLDEVERGDILPLQVYCRLAQLVICRLCDCYAYGLVRPSWRCDKNSFRWTLSELLRDYNYQAMQAVDRKDYTLCNFIIPVRNIIVRVLRDTLVRLVEFEKALNDEHIPTWYNTVHTKFYDHFLAKYQEMRQARENMGLSRMSQEQFFISYVTGEDFDHEEDN